jgi:hypothetical protein
VKRGPQTDESRRRATASAAAYWADPAIRVAHGEKTRLRMDRPEVRATISERTKVALAEPGVNARMRAGLKRAYADPALRQKVSECTKAGMADPALRQKISERTKAGIAAKLDRQFRRSDQDLGSDAEESVPAFRRPCVRDLLAVPEQALSHSCPDFVPCAGRRVVLCRRDRTVTSLPRSRSR